MIHAKKNWSRVASGILLTTLSAGIILPILAVPFHAVWAEEEDALSANVNTKQVTTEGEAGSGGTTGITGAGSCFAQAGAAAAAIGATQATPGLPVADVGARISQVLTTGGTIINCVGTFFNLIQNTITSSGIAALVAKMKMDVIATAVVKSAIKITRDMVIRWILTGRFEGPVFSQSFALDLRKNLENASRIFLGQLTGINFCAGIQIPPQAFFGISNRELACTFYGDPVRFRAGEVFDFVSLSSSESGANEYWNAAVKTLNQKRQFEEIARQSFAAEYQAGQGFLGIRGEDGKIRTPGIAVAELVIGAEIKSPREEANVVQTVQQAIGAIIDTAVKVVLEKGLGAAFGPSR